MSNEPEPRRIGRLALAFGALALASSTAFITWWSTTLMGLPDVGDPFDIASFTRAIPDETNAFVLYKQAAAILPKEPDILANYDWKTAAPEQRAWSERSLEALEVWREGTERPDARYVEPGSITFDAKVDVAQALRSFGRLALLRGSRLEDGGDVGGALDWYLALLRSSRHCGRRGTFVERLIGIAMHRWSSDRLKRWAVDPRVDAGMIRRALDAALEAEASTAPLSDGLKVEYLSLLHSINDPNLMAKLLDYEVVPDNKGGSITKYGQHPWKTSWTQVRRRSINEPERSKRVVRMAFANWLAYCDLPRAQQPPKVDPSKASPMLNGPAKSFLGELYDVHDNPPAGAKALPPEKLALWFGSTVDAEMALPNVSGVAGAFVRERAAQGALLFTLANELHKREHGQYPDNPEDLVGPYLKTLPPGYLPAK